jgi:hypothetical protein
MKWLIERCRQTVATFGKTRAVIAGLAACGIAAAIIISGCSQGVPLPPEGEYRGFAGEQRVVIRGYDGDAMEPFVTRDGRYLMFNNRNEAPQNTNLHFATRVDDLTFDYRGEIKGVNTAALEGVPSMDRDNNFYFVATGDYDKTFSTLYRGRFENGTVSGIDIVPGVSRRKPGIVNFDAEISGDGNTLYFVDGDFSSEPKPSAAELVIAVRRAGAFERDPNSRETLKNVNGRALVYAPAISEDGLELFFTRVAKITPTAQPAIYRSVRNRPDRPFGVPETVVGIAGFVEAATFSADEKALYYHKKEKDQFVICRVSRKSRSD